MDIVECFAILDEEPIPVFIADRPFLAIIVVDNSFYFMAIQRGVWKRNDPHYQKYYFSQYFYF